MLIRKKIKSLASLSALALVASAALTGCGPSGPSDADVQAAMLRQLEQVFGKEAAAKQKGEFGSVKVVKCEKAQLGAFVCEFDGPMGHAVGRFKKESEGWIFLGSGA